MDEIIEYLEKKIKACDELGGMELPEEKFAYVMTLKKVREIALKNKYTVDAYLESIGENEAICNCENEYWKEDEGGDWYCTIHDKEA